MIFGVCYYSAVFFTVTTHVPINVFIFQFTKREFLARVIRILSHSGDGFFYPLIAGGLYLLYPEIGLKFIIVALAAFGIELPLFILLKKLFKRDRPYKVIPGINNIVTPVDRFSFPSGHTAAACVFSTLLIYFFSFLIIPLACWAMLVGFSRVFLGVHYPTDILAGIALGTGSASMAIMVVGRLGV